MKQNILIICLSLVLLTCSDNYYLSLDMLISGSTKYKLDLLNRNEKASDNDLFYSGSAENMENILLSAYNNKEKYSTIKDKSHPFVLMLDECLFEYINYFSTNSLFVINHKCLVNIKTNYKNYKIFYLVDDSAYLRYLLEKSSIYYIKLGKELEKGMNIFIYVILGLTMLINIFLSFIMKRILRNMDDDNVLLVNYLICNIADLLFMANIGNILSFFFFMGKQALDFLSEYIIVFLLALYKGSFYTSAILLLQGWMTTTFVSIGDNFKKYYKRILIYELLFSLFLQISVYFINFTSKLNLFYIKSEIEQMAFMSFIIYCFIKKMVPLYKQIVYEQGIRSDLVKCLKFKFKKFIKIYILFTVHCIWTIFSPLIDKKIIYSYIYNYHLHFVLQLFYEVIFCLGLDIIFIPQKLPRYFYDEIIYNYKEIVFLEADIFEGDDEENHNKKLNISNLTFDKLKKASKKENYPIILVNPFASSRDQLLFNHIHVGIAQRYQKSQ